MYINCAINDSIKIDSTYCFAYNYDDIGNRLCSIGTGRFIWDPTEPVATRPLVFNYATASPAYYTHDGNKNVSELVDENEAIVAHYEYEAFGAVCVKNGTSTDENPWGFSSEYNDDVLRLVYYNYRHYEPVIGRWIGRDPKIEFSNLYLIVNNNAIDHNDFLGLFFKIDETHWRETPPDGWGDKGGKHNSGLTRFVMAEPKTSLKNCDIGKYKLSVYIPNAVVYVYFRDDYSRVIAYPDEMEHIACYRAYYNRIVVIKMYVETLGCLCRDDAKKIELSVGNLFIAAVNECDICNGNLDMEGGPHGH